MKLSFEQVSSVAFGYVRSFADGNGMHFMKCSEKQIAAFASFSEGLAANASATTGIRLDFYTDSAFFAFEASSGRRFELYVNGVFKAVFIRESEGAQRFSFDLDPTGRENRVTLFFPSHDAPGVLSSVELSDGASLAPHAFDKKLFFIGDSITQGWESGYDSLSFAIQVSDFFNAESVIQGIGGAFFDESIFDPDIDFEPDAVIVAFGTNDWGARKSLEEIASHANAFLSLVAKRFEGKKLFAISPIWRANAAELRASGYFCEVCDAVKLEIAKNNFTLIDGYLLTPHMPDFYSDKYLHPNAVGFGVYAHNLCKVLKDRI